MKKPTLKLVIRRETLRVLPGLELVLVRGGDPDAQPVDTRHPALCVNVGSALPEKP